MAAVKSKMPCQIAASAREPFKFRTNNQVPIHDLSNPRLGPGKSPRWTASGCRSTYLQGAQTPSIPSRRRIQKPGSSEPEPQRGHLRCVTAHCRGHRNHQVTDGCTYILHEGIPLVARKVHLQVRRTRSLQAQAPFATTETPKREPQLRSDLGGSKRTRCNIVSVAVTTVITAALEVCAAASLSCQTSKVPIVGMPPSLRAGILTHAMQSGRLTQEHKATHGNENAGDDKRCHEPSQQLPCCEPPSAFLVLAKKPHHPVRQDTSTFVMR